MWDQKWLPHLQKECGYNQLCFTAHSGKKEQCGRRVIEASKRSQHPDFKWAVHREWGDAIRITIRGYSCDAVRFFFYVIIGKLYFLCSMSKEIHLKENFLKIAAQILAPIPQTLCIYHQWIHGEDIWNGLPCIDATRSECGASTKHEINNRTENMSNCIPRETEALSQGVKGKERQRNIKKRCLICQKKYRIKQEGDHQLI